MTLDATHNPLARSWVASANEPGCDFPIQNLPYGRFRPKPTEAWRAGVAIGDDVLDLQGAGLTESADIREVIHHSAAERLAIRHALFNGLAEGSPRRRQWEAALFVQSEVELALPCEVGDHRGLCASGQRVLRPNGPVLSAGDCLPHLQPSQRMDYALALAIWLAQGNNPGEPIPMAQAEDCIWGLTLLNNWSARDLQAWESQWHGAFLSSNFATTVSPWVVTLDALAPFRCKPARPQDAAQPPPYLDSPANRSTGGIDIQFEVWLQTAQMQADGETGHMLSQSGFTDAYWTLAQLLAHHTANGCPLQAGDVLGTGTLSGPQLEEGGSLQELSLDGSHPLSLHNGELRTFLEDGDSVILKAYAVNAGARRIGFGECRGTLLGARH